MPAILTILACLFLVLVPGRSHAAHYALLVGIADYSDPRITDLEGPVNDVTALRKTLIDHWQFSPDAITSLTDRQATETAILDALDALARQTRPGDNILIYFSGHGTSAQDVNLGARINLPDGSGAIVTSDFNPDKLHRDTLTGPRDDGLLVGRFELKPRFQALDEQRNVLIIFDACFSGNSVRAVNTGYTPSLTRQLSLLEKLTELLSDDDDQTTTPEGQTSLFNTSADESDQAPSSHFNYRNSVYFGAAAENQEAVDFSQADISAGLVSSFDGKPHGGFTDALLRVLNEPGNHHDGSTLQLSYASLFNKVINQFNIHCKVCGHTPVSLPVLSDNRSGLLHRRFLVASSDLPAGPAYSDINEPVMAEHLNIDTLNADDMPLQLATRAALDELVINGRGSPDVVFEQRQQTLYARAADGSLITSFPDDVADAHIEQLIRGQAWLKQRQQADLHGESGNLRVDFRHPLQGNQVSAGDFIHFTASNETDAHLIALLLDAAGALSVLYPVNQKEAGTLLKAGALKRIPAIDELQMQVTPPWGTDTVLFYALPPDHGLMSEVMAMARQTRIPFDDESLQVFESALNQGQMPYSASTVRIVASQSP